MGADANAHDDVVIGPADAETQAGSVRGLIAEWGHDGGPTPHDVVCWSPRWAWILLAREAGAPVPAMRAVNTVNRLIETHHPTGDYAAEEVRVLQHAGALRDCLEHPDHNANSRPLVPRVLQNWEEVMVLYNELANKLIGIERPELACTVYWVAHRNRDQLVYDERAMETLEMAALMAGDEEVPMLGVPASEYLEMVNDDRKQARPLPRIARDYHTVLYYPVSDPHGRDIVTDPQVIEPMPTPLEEAKGHWEAVLLSQMVADVFPEPDPDVRFFTSAAVEFVRIKWSRMGYEDRRHLDAFGVKVMGSPVSRALGLSVGMDPEL